MATATATAPTLASIPTPPYPSLDPALDHTISVSDLGDAWKDCVYSLYGGAKGERYYRVANLAELRRAAVVTQQELAAVASKIAGRLIMPHTVGELERGERGARRRTLEPIADALGIRALDLVRPLADAEREALGWQLGRRFISLPGHQCD